MAYNILNNQGSVLTQKFLIKISLFSLLLLFVIALSSCEGPRGPVGPQGNSISDGYTKINTDEFVIQPTNWNKLEDNTWNTILNVPNITTAIEERGFVLIYMKANNNQTWVNLPYTFIDRDNQGSVFSTEYTSWWGIGKVEIQFRDTHPTQPLALNEPITIKVVSALDIYRNQLLPIKKDYLSVRSKINKINHFEDLNDMIH
jgi:hypothetical protein